MLQIVASLTDDSRGLIYECNIFIIPATDEVSVFVKELVLVAISK